MKFCIGACLWALSLAAAEQAPLRIVSTAPSTTETLFALGLGERVVGISTYCHYPPEATRLPRVGTFMQPNVETIARLRPDLVILQKMPASAAGRLSSLGLKVLELETGNLQRNLDNIVTIGRAAGAAQRAEQLVAGIRRELAGMKSGRKRSVVFVVGRTPGKLEGLIAVGAGSYLSELLAAAGGENIFADVPRDYFKTSLEAIVRRNPEVILDMGDMSETATVSDAHKQAVVALWAQQPALKAVKSRAVFAIASDIFVVPGPRMLDAAREFKRLLGQAP